MERAVVQLLNDDGTILADLDRAFDIGYELIANGVSRAWFRMRSTDPKRALCATRKLLRIRDGTEWIGPFRILPVIDTKGRTASTVKFEAEHVLATLVDEMLVGVHNTGIGTVDALEYILDPQWQTNGVKWQLGTVELTRGLWHSFENKTLLEAIIIVCDELGDYLLETDTTTSPWTLHIRELSDAVLGTARFKSNMTSISRIIDPEQLCTRLYVYGYGVGADQLNISYLDIESGQFVEVDSVSYEIHRGEDPPVDTGKIWLDTSEKDQYGYTGVRWPYRWRLYSELTEEWHDVEPDPESLAPLLRAEYLDADTQDQYGIITRVWEDQRYRDEDALYEAGLKRLEKRKQPRVTYELGLVELATLAQVSADRIKQGSKIRIIDEELGIETAEYVTSFRKMDVGSTEAAVEVRIGTIQAFPQYGQVAFADDLDGVPDGAFGRVLSTQIEAGRIMLSGIPGGMLGPFQQPPTIGGLYLGATHLGYHDGNDWQTYMDRTGRLRLVGRAGGDYFDWIPGPDEFTPSVLEIKGQVSLRPGSVGYQFLTDAPQGVTRSFWQDDPPDPEEVEIDENDVWFDTSDGNRAYYWGYDEEEDEWTWLDGQDHAIAQALADALSAYNLADTKVKTYYQDSPPDPGVVELREGYLWVSTADHNKLYRWNGSNWIQVTGAVASLNVIGNAFIENLAVTDAKIASCSIGKLTAGNLNVEMNLTAGGDVKSDNFVAGTSGWRIRSDGTAEFQNATIRGTLNASDLTAGTLNFTALGRSGLSVITTEIANYAVTNLKIGSGAVTNAKIADATIQSAKIANLEVEKLTGTYLTGKYIRTATSGTRIELAPVTTQGHAIVGFMGTATRFWIRSSDGSGYFHGQVFVGETVKANRLEVYPSVAITGTGHATTQMGTLQRGYVEVQIGGTTRYIRTWT